MKKKRGIRKKLNKNRGLRYYRKKQYVKSISFLEKALREKKDDPEVYLFLGYASLYTDDTEGARRYFRGGLLVKEDDVELMKGLAYVYLKDERIEDAINLWGEILEKNPKDRRIKRALQNLRESNNIESFIQNARLRDFLSVGPPVYVKIKPYIIALSVSLGAFIIGIVFYTTPLYKKALEKFYPEVARLNRIEFPTGVPLTGEDSSALYSFSEKDIEASFLRIKKHIYKNRMNTAIIELNRIMLSNASPPVMEKFEILYKFIDTPDPLAIDYNPHFYEIMKEPAAFKGVFILWKGKIANLKKGKKSAEFDLLVNYEDEDTIAGIAHINISGTFFIENKQNVEVFGSYGGYDKETGKLLIQGILLRDLGI